MDVVFKSRIVFLLKNENSGSYCNVEARDNISGHSLKYPLNHINNFTQR